MNGKPLPNHAKNRINEASRGDVGASSPALDIDDPSKEDRAMPNSGVYGDSTSPVNPKQQSTWVPIGELASRLVRKAGA